ncbi:MAG: response regulator [Oscillospiraceae bacterium]|nr:response regulator [Oscillospiraceae bacterium]
MKKPRFVRYLHELIMGDGFDIKHKLQNMLLAISIIGGFFTVTAAFVLNNSFESKILSVSALIMQIFAFFVSAVLKKRKAGTMIVFIVINIILFPLLFYTNGGVYSGMPIWLAFGLIYPWMVSEGAMCIVMFILNTLVTVGCFTTQYFFPEWFVAPAEDNLTQWIVLDSLQVALVVAVILGMAIKYQAYVFDRQQAKMLKQEEQLRQAMKLADKSNAAKTDFLVRMSHEIRTPINAVLGMDEMILRESSDETILGYATNIQSAGQLLLATINDVLDFSKIESGKLELFPEEYSIHQLMNDCYNIIIMRAEKKNLLLEVKNDPSIPSRLVGDEIRVRQMIINLLTNAVKYTSAGKITMTLGCEKVSEEEIILKVSVRDTGMGISPENQQELFSDFNRLDETNTKNIEGTGLGLSITKRLVEKMKGKISVESTLGVGSEFRFEIPQLVASKTPMGYFTPNKRSSTEITQEYHERFQAPAARILVVDDVKLNIDVLKGLLKSTKVRVDAAYSGRECLGLVQKNSYDLIFMDHVMPEMDGVQTFNYMRKLVDCPNHNVPVIALTANAMAGAKEEYTQLGFADYLAKPVQSDLLEQLLMEYLPSDLIIPAEDTPSPKKKSSSRSDDIPEFDSEAGLKWCCGDRSLYRKILCMVDIDTRAIQLDNAFRNNDWSTYERLCCGLKSTSKTVGGERLSYLAAKMEKHVKSGEITYIRENHRMLIDCCHSLEKAANNYLFSNNSEGDK